MDLDKICKIKEDLYMLSNNIDPQTKTKITTDSVVSSNYNKKLFIDACELISEFIISENKSNCFDKRRKLFFYISEENRKKIPISQQPIPISTFSYTLNDFIDKTVMKKVKASEITGWLMFNGYLQENTHADGKVFKILTEKSVKIGMIRETKTNDYGRTYDVNLYSEQAQHFIIDNLSEISEFIKTKSLR